MELKSILKKIALSEGLTSLNFGFNSITNKGFKSVLQFLKGQSKVQEVNLQGNDLDDKVFLLMEKYGQGLAVRNLNLKNNKITKNPKKQEQILASLLAKGINFKVQL